VLKISCLNKNFSMRCNNADDCGDGSDEDSEICGKLCSSYTSSRQVLMPCEIWQIRTSLIWDCVEEIHFIVETGPTYVFL